METMGSNEIFRKPVDNIYLTGKEKFILYMDKIKSKITPIKMLSFILILLGLADNLVSPTNHNPPTFSWLNLLLQSLFIFAGIFGIMGNGKSRKIRAFVVGLPFLYLAILYIIQFIQYRAYTVIAPIIILTNLGLWTVWVGEYYDRGNHSVTSSFINRIYTELSVKDSRKDKE